MMMISSAKQIIGIWNNENPMDKEIRDLQRLVNAGDPSALARYIHYHHRMGRDHPYISTLSHVGIDYPSMGNRGSEEYRYGLISPHNLADWFWEVVESIYIPRCGHCGEEIDEEEIPETCPSCGEEIDEEEIYGEEPDRTVIDEDGIQGLVSDTEVWITDSPYYMRGTFCSPCAPGAVDLDAPTIDGPKAYCPPHDWYREGEAPHLIFRVSDNTVVYPKRAE